MILDTQYLGALADGDEAAREKATELDEPVLSNDADFQGVDGLEVVTY